MVLPAVQEVHPLRRRFPHFSPPLLEVLEACLQVGAGGCWCLMFLTLGGCWELLCGEGALVSVYGGVQNVP